MAINPNDITLDGDPQAGTTFVRIPVSDTEHLLVGVDDDGQLYVTSEDPNEGIQWEVTPEATKLAQLLAQPGQPSLAEALAENNLLR